jgi:cysteinyl-tRNA synthetase
LDTLGDDLNTAGVIAELHKLANAGDVAGLRAGAELLGLLTPNMGAWAEAVDLSAHEAHLFAARQAAMETKDFSEVDRLKSAYQAAGLEVRMSKTGVELVPSAGFDIVALDGIM